SSVSGGSITAARLGLQWSNLGFDSNGVGQAFEAEIVVPVRALARQTLDVKSVLTGLIWFDTIGERVAKAYRKNLYGEATLQDLPAAPRFVINATNLQSGALWRFSKPYMADWRVGMIRHPTLLLADAVAASSAFPPVLSPYRLKLDPQSFEAGSGADLQREPYTRRAILSDGGVYDNLGLETAYKRYDTILVSNAGKKMAPEPRPATDWVQQSIRVSSVINNQVRSLRKRSLIESYKNKSRKGAYWSIRSDIGDYPAPHALGCPLDRTEELANIPTRLKAMPEGLQERLINWGYAVTDAALRTFVDKTLPPPAGFPYPGGV
ncbi:MAG: patatin-like phospholipase family protein, partial [Methylothermaceae bacterium]|nr:patatin-like phospholipase family protein [Methylothermaceae bacterium]